MKEVTQNLVSESSESEALNREKMKIKLVDDNGYFSSYSHFGIHLEMLSVWILNQFFFLILILSRKMH